MPHHRNSSLPVAAAQASSELTSGAYPPDDGPLNEDQLEAIRQLVAMPVHRTVRSTLLPVGLNDDAIKPRR